MSRYRIGEEHDLIGYIKSLELRVRALESGQRAGNTSVDTGTLAVANGGSIVARRDTSFEEGAISVTTDDVVDGQTGLGLHFTRSETVRSGVQDVAGATAVSVQSIEGQGTGNVRYPTVNVYDKNGDVFLSDAHNGRRGMGEPKLHSTWFDVTVFKSTTSGSFAYMFTCHWYMYHPHVRVRTYVQADGGTAGEVELKEPSTSKQLAVATIPTAANQFLDLTVDRRAFQFGSSPNGTVGQFDINTRRTSGGGSIRILIVEIIGIDLSYLSTYVN